MIDLAFIFTIFMVTLGPVKAIPGFYNFTKHLDPSETRSLALRGAFFATVICLVIAAVMPSIAVSWQVDPNELRIAGGILLFAPAIVYMFPQIPEWIGKIFPTYYALQPVVELSLGGGGWSDIAVNVFILIAIDIRLIIPVALVAARMMRRQ